MPGRTHGRLSAGEDRFSAVEIVPVGPPITNNHPLITHHFTVRHLPSVIPPILASFALLCGQPSAVRPQSSAVRLPPSAVPSDSCAFCASWRPTLRPPIRRPPITPFPPVKNSSVCSVCSVGQPSAVRAQSSALRDPSCAVPSDSCAFCASLRPIHRQPSVICPPPSVVRRQPSHPILARFAPLGGQPSVIPPPVAFSTRTFPREKRFCQLQNNHPRPRSFVCYSPEFLRGP